jgi:hypothetical protein
VTVQRTMNERESRWYEGTHGEHPDTCTCPVCCERRRKKEEKGKFGGKIECPRCGYLSVNYVGKQGRYVCCNPECGISGETLFELSRGQRANYGDETTKQTGKQCGAGSEDAKSVMQGSRDVTLPVRSETQISTPAMAQQKPKRRGRALSTFLGVLAGLAVTAIIAVALFELVPGLKTEILNIAAEMGFGDPLAVNPAAESYLNQGWGGQSVDVSAGGTSKLPYPHVFGQDYYVKYYDDSYVTVTNNQDAQNPTMAQLLAFLKEDHTEDIPSSEPAFVCLNYAVTLHDNAEANGIRCAVVAIYGTSVGHAVDAFQTTDGGLVFVDNSGDPHGMDAFAKITMGQEVSKVPVFRSDIYVGVSVDSELGPISNGYIWW